MPLSKLADKIFDFAKIGKLPSFLLAFVSWALILLPEFITKLLNINIIIYENRPYL